MVTTSDKKEMARFTAYFEKSEREGIAELAAQHSTSDNFILRNMVRAALGKPYSPELLKPK